MSKKTRLPSLYDGNNHPNYVPDPSDKRRGHLSKIKFPNISDTYQYSKQLLHDACLALHGIILQDLSIGKRELLKDPMFIQGRLYETITYIMTQQDKTLDQVILEYEHPKLKYKLGRIILQPKVDLVLARFKPDFLCVSTLMLRKKTAGYEPDSRSIRSDMARIAYLVLENGCQWGFYLWIGPLDELRHFEMTYSYSQLAEANGQKKTYIVLQKHTLVLPRTGKPLPSTFKTTLLLNRIAPDFCLRLYQVVPEMTMWDDDGNDIPRLNGFYSGSNNIQAGLGMWGIRDQIKNVRNQLMKIRDYIEASLFDRAHAMLMMTRVMFTDLVVVKNLERDEIDESNYLKHHIDELKARIEEGLQQRDWESTSDDSAGSGIGNQ